MCKKNPVPGGSLSRPLPLKKLGGDITLRRVPVINAVVEEHKILHILNVLSVALVNRRAKRMHHIIFVIWRDRCTIFFHSIS